MARTYVIQSGDNLKRIAKNFYGDSQFYKKLADYNAIRNPDLIFIGQAIEIPSKNELEGKKPEPVALTIELNPPNGLEQILSTFGNIYDYIGDDGILDSRWESDQLSRSNFPFPLSLSWDPSKTVSRIYCHKKLVGIFPEVFSTIEKEGLKSEIRTFGGCFNFRSKRTSGKLSTHSWGIAIDINPETNPMGKLGDIHSEVVAIFQKYGFTWGGNWSGKGRDPMHFQFCMGY